MKKLLVSAVVVAAVLALSSVSLAQTAGVWADYWMSATTVTGEWTSDIGDVTVTGYSTIVGAEAQILSQLVIGGEYVTRPAGVVGLEAPLDNVSFTQANSLMDVWLGYKLLEDGAVSFYPLVGYLSASFNLGITAEAPLTRQPVSGDVTASVAGFVVGAGASLNLGNALSASGRFLYAYSLAGTLVLDADGLTQTIAGSGYVGEGKLSYAILPQVAIEGGYRLSSFTVYPTDYPEETVTAATSGVFAGVSARF